MFYGKLKDLSKIFREKNRQLPIVNYQLSINKGKRGEAKFFATIHEAQ